MTATNYLGKTDAIALDIEQPLNDFTLRPASTGDAERLAELFTIAYGQTTHPCQSPDYIHKAMLSGQQRWFVVESGNLLAGCSCIARRPWNRSWEVCHGVVHPDARRTGVISSLVKASLEDHSPETMELGFYITRNMASHSVMKKIRPALLVGHDGGPDKVDGIREYHLTALHPRAPDGFAHAAPHYVNAPGMSFITHYLYESLALDAVPGVYPDLCLSGPPGTEQQGRLVYAHDRAAGALTLTGCVGPVTEQALIAELTAFVQQWKHVEYLGVQVLADKLELVGSLIRLGFSITAYLPAWHLQAGVRYDCIMLVRQHFPQAPRSHGFESDVIFFDEAYSRLADSLCNLCPPLEPLSNQLPCIL